MSDPTRAREVQAEYRERRVRFRALDPTPSVIAEIIERPDPEPWLAKWKLRVIMNMVPGVRGATYRTLLMTLSVLDADPELGKVPIQTRIVIATILREWERQLGLPNPPNKMPVIALVRIAHSQIASRRFS